MRVRWVSVLLVACGTDGGGKDRDGTGTTSGLGTATGAGTGSGTGTGTGAGTGSGTGTGAATGGTPVRAVEIGNGETSHTPATPGQVVTMVHGPQQGWHIEVSGEVVGLGGIVGVEAWAERVDDNAVVASNGNATFLQLAGYDATTTEGWFAGERVFVDPPDQTFVCDLEGVAVRLCARAEDLAAPGTFADGCVEVTLGLDAADIATCAGP